MRSAESVPVGDSTAERSNVSIDYRRVAWEDFIETVNRNVTEQFPADRD